MALIDVNKVRKWTTELVIQKPLESWPVPARIVSEEEGPGYRIRGLQAPWNRQTHGGQLTVTIAGRGCLRGGNIRHELAAGSAFLYRINDAAVQYFYPADGREPWRFLWIHFDGEAAERLIAELNQRYGYVYDVSGVPELIERLLRYRGAAGTAAFLTPGEGGRLAAELFELLCRAGERQEALSPAAMLVCQVQRLFSEDLSAHWTAERLAKRLELSREHLSKLFKQRTGETIHACLLRQRLTAARDLLLKTALPCKEIMARCGFGSYSSFYRAFQHAFGTAPENFRTQCTGTELRRP